MGNKKQRVKTDTPSPWILMTLKDSPHLHVQRLIIQKLWSLTSGQLFLGLFSSPWTSDSPSCTDFPSTIKPVSGSGTHMQYFFKAPQVTLVGSRGVGSGGTAASDICTSFTRLSSKHILLFLGKFNADNGAKSKDHKWILNKSEDKI